MIDPTPEMMDRQNRETVIVSLLGNVNGNWPCSDFYAHLEKVLWKLPAEVLETLYDRIGIIFAPSKFAWGRVMTLSLRDGYCVYFSPCLLDEATTVIEGVIAHELAHVYLGHEEAPVPDTQDSMDVATHNEREADRVATAWGFEQPQSSWKEPAKEQ